MPGVRFVGLFDEEESRGQACAAQYGVALYSECADLLSEVDGVVICSENRLHFPYAKQAAEAGVHILVEKPITTDGNEARELIGLCEQKQVWLQTAFPVRMNTSVHQVKRRLDQGDIGQVLAITATNHSKMPGGWFVDPERSGGGAVLDHTVHVLDILRWMLKSEVKSVYAEIGTLLHDIPSDDCGLLSLTFENGIVATLDTSWSRPASFPIWSDVSLRIIGTKGVLHLDMHGQVGHVWENGAALTHRQVPWGDSANQALIGEFVDSIRVSRPPLISGEDGLRAAEVAWAAYRSAQEKRPVAVQHY
jgi:predicted dehydrogenase